MNIYTYIGQWKNIIDYGSKSRQGIKNEKKSSEQEDSYGLGAGATAPSIGPNIKISCTWV
jgi:hypothetical protein